MKNFISAVSSLVIVALLASFTLIWFTPGQTAKASGNLSAADWAQIQSFLPADAPSVQQAYLKSSNPFSDDWFGYSVAVDGDTLAVGAVREDTNPIGVDEGAVYIFTRTSNTWSQQARLTVSNSNSWDAFGYSLAISGDTLVVGANGEASDGSSEADNSKSAAGAAYVFTRTGNTWSQQAYLKASNPDTGDQFGSSVAISGDTIVVGGHNEDGDGSSENDNSQANSGAAYVFIRSGTAWSQQAYLKSSNPLSDDNFGHSVAITGDTLATGAHNEATGGAAYIFTRAGTIWSQQARLTASNPDSDDRFGFSVAISGNTLAVGAAGEDSNGTSESDDSLTGAGAAYIFTGSGASWSQQAYLKASNPDADDAFGLRVAIDGDTLIVGAPGEDSDSSSQTNNSKSDSGAAYIFTRDGLIWGQQAYLKASNVDANDWFGDLIAIDGDTVAAGAFFEDGDGSSENDNSVSQAGAVYVFVPPTPATDTPTPTMTSSPTASATPTETATPTQTATDTATKTNTPTTTTLTLNSIAAQDGWILESNENSNIGGTFNSTAATLKLGDDAEKRQYRSILSFQTSVLPDNATIKSIMLIIKPMRIIGGGNPLAMFQGFMVDAKSGSFGLTALQASDFQQAASTTFGQVSRAHDGAGYHYVTLTPLKTRINKLTTGGGLTQLRLRFQFDDNNNGIANQMIFYSGNAANQADRPRLVINYTVP